MIAVSSNISINGKKYYITPNGAILDGSRIGQYKDGICVSSPNLSNAEIERLRLTGKVIPNTDQNSEKLYP